MTKDNKVVQVLRPELLRPVRVHLKSGRTFIVRRTDYILGDLDGFIISRPRHNNAPEYVETVRSTEVVGLDLKLRWWLPVAWERPPAGKPRERRRKERSLCVYA